MGLRRRFASPSMVVALLALVVAVGGVAVAAIPGSGGVISACYQEDDGFSALAKPIQGVSQVLTPAGSMRVVEDSGDCDNSEEALTFNQKGPAGPPGPQGKAGPSGPLTATARSADFEMNAAKNLNEYKTVLGNNPKQAGTYLVLAQVGITTSGTTGGDPDVTCALQKGDAEPVAKRVLTWPSGSRYSGSIPLLRVMDLKASQTAKVVCSPRYEKGSISITPYMISLKIGG